MRIDEHTDVIDLTVAPDPVVAGDPARPRRSAAGRRRRGIALTLICFAGLMAMFAVYLFLLSGLVEGRSQRLLLTRFQALTDQGVATTEGWKPVPGDPVALLTIPRLGLQQVVVEGTSSSDTMAGPGHYRGSPLPGRPGNSVIAGRRTTYGSPFAHLSELVKGDTVDVSTGMGKFTYVVTGSSEITPNHVDAIVPTSDNRLTLMTSTPKYRASGRLVVTATLVGPPARATLQPAPVIPQDETGLSGQPWALAPLLLWTEILLGGLFVGLWLARRVSRRVAWLLVAPFAFAMLWAMFLSLSRLLPATL